MWCSNLCLGHVMMPDTIHPPANVCIYCGAKTYAPDSNRFLAEEHIIPLGLNGTEVLPRASCRRCERITGRVENLVLRGALLGCRTILQLATRSPKDRPKALPLFYRVDGTERKVMVPMEDYPANLLLIRLEAPGVFRDPTQGRPGWHPWHHLFVDKMAVLQRTYGINEFSPAMLDTYSFTRMLAKIAHSFATAHMGVGGFRPLLPELILDDSGSELAARNLLQFVGGLPDLEPREDLLHWIRIEDPTPENIHFIVVRLRLFAMLGSPTYRIVVGRRLRIGEAAA
jgi:hypothetical protein